MTTKEKKQLYELFSFLLTHNKNYTKKQYYAILDAATILNTNGFLSK